MNKELARKLIELGYITYIYPEPLEESWDDLDPSDFEYNEEKPDNQYLLIKHYTHFDGILTLPYNRYTEYSCLGGLKDMIYCEDVEIIKEVTYVNIH